MSKLKALAGRTLRAVAKPFGYAVVGGGLRWPQLLFNPLLRLGGVQLVPTSQVGRTYLDCKSTVENAKLAGLSVPQYVAKLWGEEGVIEAFIDHLSSKIDLSQCRRVLEIGAGTGRFLEPIAERATPIRYEVYETNLDWANHLASVYGAVAQPANGVNLDSTPDASQELVHADYVFAYLPVRTCFDYFHEMCRVCAPGGYVVFDAYLADQQNLAAIESWREHAANYQVILPRSTVVDFFKGHGFDLIDGDYQMKSYVGFTQYLIFRKSIQ